MEFQTFVKRYNKICTHFLSRANGCQYCPFGRGTTTPSNFIDKCAANIWQNYSEAEFRMDEYLDKHPIKTRQMVFLKLYPNAKIDKYNEVIGICPCDLDAKYPCAQKNQCDECRKDYWLSEVD